VDDPADRARRRLAAYPAVRRPRSSGPGSTGKAHLERKEAKLPSPKVVVIGAGSHFFARPVIWNMTHSPVLRGGTLALVDTHRDVLQTFENLARS